MVDIAKNSLPNTQQRRPKIARNVISVYDDRGTMLTTEYSILIPSVLFEGSSASICRKDWRCSQIQVSALYAWKCGPVPYEGLGSEMRFVLSNGFLDVGFCHMISTHMTPLWYHHVYTIPLSR